MTLSTEYIWQLSNLVLYLHTEHDVVNRTYLTTSQNTTLSTEHTWQLSKSVLYMHTEHDVNRTHLTTLRFSAVLAHRTRPCQKNIPDNSTEQDVINRTHMTTFKFSVVHAHRTRRQQNTPDNSPIQCCTCTQNTTSAEHTWQLSDLVLYLHMALSTDTTPLQFNTPPPYQQRGQHHSVRIAWLQPWRFQQWPELPVTLHQRHSAQLGTVSCQSRTRAVQWVMSAGQ